MKHLFTNKKLIITSLFFVFSFSLGAYARPGIDLTGEILGGMFGSKDETYVAPPSEYEVAVNTLWKSERHQSICKANAAAVVAIDLARKYLEEGQKQAVLASYDMPIEEAVKNASGYKQK